MKLENAEEVIDLSKYLNRDVYIIGGAKTFEAFAEVIEQWVVTTVPDEVKGADTFMPRNFLDDFEGRRDKRSRRRPASKDPAPKVKLV